MSVSDPRPASELVYASSHLRLCWISDKHPKPVFQNGSPPLSPTYFSHSHPHLLTATSLSSFGLKTSNSSLTLLFLLYSSYDPSANVVTTYPRCLPTCYHSGLSCRSICSPSWPVSAVQSQQHSWRVRHVEDHVNLPGWSNVYVPSDRARTGQETMWNGNVGPLFKSRKKLLLKVLE